jgi:cytochrome c biogenesis protein CcmG/thiol:disulfide interchange protein DsbE
MLRFLVPLGIFAALVAFLWVGLGKDPSLVPSPLIGKPAPAFRVAQLHDANSQIGNADMLGKVWLLNVWASWCASCRHEHPLFMELARARLVPIYGLNYKDKREDGVNWLSQLGDPYVVSAFDEDGRVGIDYGVYGVPETYVIDRQGIIRYKHVGPVTMEALQTKILPLVKELEKI